MSLGSGNRKLSGLGCGVRILQQLRQSILHRTMLYAIWFSSKLLLRSGGIADQEEDGEEEECEDDACVEEDVGKSDKHGEVSAALKFQQQSVMPPDFLMPCKE